MRWGAPSLLASFLGLASLAADAATIVVNDASDILHSPGCATSGTGTCSLRDAITFANGNPGGDVINFSFPGTAVITIAIASPLPAVTGQTTIDGCSQPGSAANTNAAGLGTNATPKIELDLAGAGGAGLTIAGANSVVRGLVIHRSPGTGITVSGDNVVIAGNFIGTDASGTSGATGNAGDGIVVASQGVIVGGSAPADVNLISANGAAGIRTVAPGRTTITGNRIGVNAAGTAALPNATDGITLASDFNQVGGPLVADANVISGNVLRGISVSGVGSMIQGNIIGRIGSSGSGQVIAGIDVQPSSSLVGIGEFTVPGTANEIAFNGGTGIFVGGVGAPAAKAIFIGGNSIFGNGGLGIKLGSGTWPGTPTPNDAGDPDTGANNLQNYPIITAAAISGGTLTVSGTLNSNPFQDESLAFFSNAACDASGNGEGQSFLGFLRITTDAAGNGGFSATYAIPPGQTIITATATNVFTRDSSEFSPCFAVAGAAAANSLPVPALGAWQLAALLLAIAALGAFGVRRRR